MIDKDFYEKPGCTPGNVWAVVFMAGLVFVLVKGVLLLGALLWLLFMRSM